MRRTQRSHVVVKSMVEQLHWRIDRHGPIQRKPDRTRRSAGDRDRRCPSNDIPHHQTETFRGLAMVLRLSSDEPMCFGNMATSWRSKLSQPPGLGKSVAYASQFLDANNRAHRGKAKIKARLIADLDPEKWELPPKPKWMRWLTYSRYEARFDRYEAILGDGIADLVARFFSK